MADAPKNLTPNQGSMFLQVSAGTWWTLSVATG
jgi:hypothetical protein